MWLECGAIKSQRSHNNNRPKVNIVALSGFHAVKIDSTKYINADDDSFIVVDHA